MRALVLADTHVAEAGPRRLPTVVRAAAEQADVVLHAGDVVEGWVLDELARQARVYAVLGNNDHSLRDALPDRLEVELAGVRVALVHDSGPRAGREKRLGGWFPTAQVVIFGHSHSPMKEWHDGRLLFNPGSATWKRTAPTASFGWITLAAGEVTAAQIVPC